MKKQNAIRCALAIFIGALLLLNFGCAPKEVGKIPITTSSKQARQLFIQGRNLIETLQAQESRQYFEQAVEKDPNFALAYLFLCNSQSSAKGFFEYLEKAVGLVDKASEGEKDWILGTEAGVNGFPMKQREYYQKLVAAYPNDERAHNLLATHYFGLQDYSQAIAEYNKATEIAPTFSQPYNQLGYAYRFMENYPEAEKAFQKYIELIPNDPNPYDSYAELLMKMGRFDESIQKYQEALERNPNFVASFVGTANNYNLKGDYNSARSKLKELFTNARNDGERRAALFAMAVSYVDEGNLDEALARQDDQYALAEAIDDAAAMSGDVTIMGNIYLEKGEPDIALEKFQMAVDLIENSNLSNDVKNNTKRNFLYVSARAALLKNDLATAKSNLENFRQQVEAIKAPLQIRLAHELAGMIALAEKQYDIALAELQQANQQDPYNWYRRGLAYQGMGDMVKAKECFTKAAKYNALNNLNYVFIRAKAQKMADSL